MFSELPEDCVNIICEFHGVFSYINLVHYKFFPQIKNLYKIECESQTYNCYVWESIRKKKHFYIMFGYNWKKFPKYYLSKYCIYSSLYDIEFNDYKYLNITFPMNLVDKRSNFSILIYNPNFNKEQILKWKKYIDHNIVQYSKYLDKEISREFMKNTSCYDYGGNIKNASHLALVKGVISDKNLFERTLYENTINIPERLVWKNTPIINELYTEKEFLKYGITNNNIDIDLFLSFSPNISDLLKSLHRKYFYKRIKWRNDLIDKFEKEKYFDWKIMSDYLPICEYNLRRYPDFKPTYKNKFYRSGDKVINKSACKYL